MKTDQHEDRHEDRREETPKFPETKSAQPRSQSSQGTDHRGHEQDDNAGAKDHRRRVAAGDARKNDR